MELELTHHLGYTKHPQEGYNSGNSRNGHSKKTVQGNQGELEIRTRETGTGVLNLQSYQKAVANLKDLII